MNNTIIPVEPKIINNTIVGMQINFLSLILDVNVIVNVLLYNSDNIVIQNQVITIEGEEYDLWGNDDDYLINLIASKLGLTIITNPIIINQNNLSSESNTKLWEEFEPVIHM